ncbi:MAG: CAAX prenyl protease-related protein [Candidatus Woesearchaeota archaeon]
MREFIIPFLFYLGVFPIVFFFTEDATIAIIFQLFIVFGLIIYYHKDYRFKWSLDLLAIFVGVSIFFIWILLENLPYPRFHTSPFVPQSAFDSGVRLLSLIGLAPIIEEFFTRFFLTRLLVDNNWKRVPVGKYTPLSFVFTILFFGFAHDRWLAGIIAGVALNLLLYYRKNIGSCILAHATANLILGIYIVSTGNWSLW